MWSFREKGFLGASICEVHLGTTQEVRVAAGQDPAAVLALAGALSLQAMQLGLIRAGYLSKAFSQVRTPTHCLACRHLSERPVCLSTSRTAVLLAVCVGPFVPDQLHYYIWAWKFITHRAVQCAQWSCDVRASADHTAFARHGWLLEMLRKPLLPVGCQHSLCGTSP